MVRESRAKKSLLNARVNMICYFASLIVAFFTRKVFLDQFGAEFIGFTGTIQSLLGFLNLAELGIGSAIGYVLYKPIFEDDRVKINEIISVFGYIYRCIGLFILGMGAVMSLFLPMIFPSTSFSWPLIYFAFYSYLLSSLLGYFVNYRMCLLSADQRNYVVTGYFQLTTTTRVIIQMVLALTICSFYLYILLEIVFAGINSVILQWKINKTYPWLESDIKLGHRLFKKYPEVVKYTKQLFTHKIGSFVQFQLAPFIIYAYVSLPIVALYGNYTMIVQRLQGLVGGVLSSTGAGIGNLIAEGDKEKIYEVYKEFLSVRIFVAGILTVCLYMLIGGFITEWLGKEYELSRFVTVLICIQFFMSIVRESTDQFLFGYGLFYDIWAPVVESLVFVAASVALGALYGLPGVLAGPLLSTFIIVYLWKPYFLFSKGFGIPYILYWVEVAKNILIFLIAASASIFLFNKCDFIGSITDNGWMKWIGQSCIFTGIMVVVSGMCFYLMMPCFRTFVARLKYRRK